MTGGGAILLHICCAPCLAGPLAALRDEGCNVSGYFYNPNIHPLIEFRRRLKALRVFQESDPIPVERREEYGLAVFLREVYRDGEPGRCLRCYRLRLTETARKARSSGAQGFTTTLLVSPHQQHDLIRAAGEEVARAEGVPFVYRDFRPVWHISEESARERLLYRQSYCGCVFSEEERYRDTRTHLYRGQGDHGNE
jgi:epoxyqueuosine reductase